MQYQNLQNGNGMRKIGSLFAMWGESGNLLIERRTRNPRRSAVKRTCQFIDAVKLFSSLLMPLTLLSAGPAKPKAQSVAALLPLPLSFEANRGQADPSVKFVSHGALGGPQYTLLLTADGAVFEFPDQAKSSPATVSMRFAGSRTAQISAGDPLPGKVNYFIGNDSKKWITGAPTYRKVDYRTVYPGIDLTFYGTQQQIEYDFVVAPGADPQRIAMEFSGAKPKIGSGGDLQLAVDGIPLTLRKPVVYQTIRGQRKRIGGEYKLHGNRVQFTLGAYDRGEALVIDPVLDYLSFYGGPLGNVFIGYSQTQCAQCTPGSAQGVAVDNAGNLYVTGTTQPASVPTVNAYQPTPPLTNPNGYMAFVAEINPTASALVYSTYLGGSLEQRGSAIAVDSSGAAYVTGETHSNDFPVTAGAYQTRCSAAAGPSGTVVSGCGSFSQNAFLTKLAPGGGSLVYSTFLGGGAGADAANAVAVDSQGRAYVAGTSADGCNSSLPLPMGNVAGQDVLYCFPETTNALLPQSLYDAAVHPNVNTSGGAAFVAVLDAAGANLLYSTLYGDKNVTCCISTIGIAVAVDPAGNFYLAGLGQTPNLPTTPNAFQPTGTNNQKNGGVVYRGFVAKFGPVTGVGAGAPFIYGTYLGGTALNEIGSDQVSGIAVDSSGNAYITGLTQSYDFPVTPGANNTTQCAPPASSCLNIGFLTKLNPSGTGLVWSTLVGGPTDPTGNGTTNQIGAPRVDASGNVYITGQGAYNFPVVNPLQRPAQDLHGGVFVTKYDPMGSTISFSTVIYSPAGAILSPGGIDVDFHGDIYVGGYSNAVDLPVTAGVFQPTSNSGNAKGGFLAKITPSGASAGTPVISEIDNAFSNIPNSPIQSGTWVAIKGTNLSSTNPGRGWSTNENFPTSMDGTSVTINGKPAFMYYISPTQVNVQAPSDSTVGPVNVIVTHNDNSSAPATAQYQASSPALLQWGGGQYTYAEMTRYPDNAYIGNPAVVPGTNAAKAGDILTLWVTGLGATDPPLAAGQQPQFVNGSFPAVSTAPTVTVGGVNVTVLGSILRFAGLYQVNVQLPASLPSGNLPIKVIQGSYQSPDGVLIAVR
jgi:uncharacterized protein (TIGR03437 family)